MHLQNDLDGLDKVKLLVAGGSPEVVAQNGLRLALDFASVGDKVDAALFAKGWIGEHYVKAVAGVAGQAIIDADRADGAVVADAVQVEVHHTGAPRRPQSPSRVKPGGYGCLVPFPESPANLLIKGERGLSQTSILLYKNYASPIFPDNLV